MPFFHLAPPFASSRTRSIIIKAHGSCPKLNNNEPFPFFRCVLYVIKTFFLYSSHLIVSYHKWEPNQRWNSPCRSSLNILKRFKCYLDCSILWNENHSQSHILIESAKVFMPCCCRTNAVDRRASSMAINLMLNNGEFSASIAIFLLLSLSFSPLLWLFRYFVWNS